MVEIDEGEYLELMAAKDAMGEELAKLRAENAELKLNAQRYRWLRDKAVRYESKDGGDSVWCVSGTSHQDCRPCEDDELDAAIDAAMKGQT